MPVTPTNTESPKPVFWFKVYTTVMGLIYLGIAALGLIFLVVDPNKLETSPAEARIFGAGFTLLGLVLAAVFFLPLTRQPRPWVWVYDLVLICIGLTSACLIPACVPLLIFWMKPETKAHFGRA
jgi:hypothetical protein